MSDQESRGQSNGDNVMECPICKSRRISLLPWLGIIYECKKCGYRGPIALEEKKSKPKKSTT